MAQDKKSFLLYTDLIHTLEHLTDAQAGQLFKTVLQYVNDENPEPEDQLIKIAFEPIKRALKRDLAKYENYIQKQRENGKRGGRPKKPKETQKTQPFNSKPKKADNDNVNDSDSDSVNDILLEKETKELFKVWLDYRKEIKKPIKNITTLKTLAKRFNKEGPGRARAVINHSIENQYQGLFWDKAETLKKETPNLNSPIMKKMQKYA